MLKVIRKPVPNSFLDFIKQGTHPVVARALASRGVISLSEARPDLKYLVPYTELKNCVKMAELIADSIANKKSILVIADYDADGATACSIAYLALREFGADTRYLIPNRIVHSYGLTPEIVEVAAALEKKPDYILTVDNGISSEAGIQKAKSLGMEVLVTDHHLPASFDVSALCVVNPNQRGCEFPSKALAGCGVIYYVMWALQDELIYRGHTFFNPNFTIEQLLPLVAVGTVADVVALDHNNRCLVNAGLSMIRNNTSSLVGIDALAAIGGKDPRKLSTSDIGFVIGPRINAAGRLESMDIGVECLTSASLPRAMALAKKLDDINKDRKDIEFNMVEEATNQLLTKVDENKKSVCLFENSWHQGVIGIVAGRIKEKVWKPTFILSPAGDGIHLKGSGRSIPGLHLRDALDLVDKLQPGVLIKFGGHSMAAGLTIKESDFELFSRAFEEAVNSLVSPEDLLQVVETDGGLSGKEICLTTVKALKQEIWGQHFPEPIFEDTFKIVEAKLIGGGLHCSFLLEKDRLLFRAVKFKCSELPMSKNIKIAYKIDANTFKEETNVQILIEHILEEN